MTTESASWVLGAPSANEYAEYYHTYVGQVPAGNILEILEKELGDTLSLFQSIPEGRGTYRYAEGKWSIKEVFGHVIDTERVFALRCLAFARGDPNAFPSFDQDDYVEATNFGARTLADLREEFQHVRHANLVLFRSLTDEEMARRGIASGVEFSARSIPYVLAGHEIHHKKTLRERYLV